ncbi:ubiquinone anaerobic biosynthesis protein UbiU [Endozoicomonadaceae bacterium StTr2]
MELVCPAGSLPALKAAVENGADAVYIGFRDDTNARHFAGLNFNEKRAQQALDHARSRGVKLLVAINTFPQPGRWDSWKRAVDNAADLGADAIIAADTGVLDYAAKRHPDTSLHLSVQGSATSKASLAFYQKHFNIKRAVLPRVLSLKQVIKLAENTPVPLEVFAFGSLCIMAEGRCLLSSYMTGQSPNNFGACSPASAVRWEEKSDGSLDCRLNGVLTDRFAPGERAGYPTLCKGRYNCDGKTFHVIEEPVSLNTMNLLPQLMKAGISAVKIEGRQRSPAYTADVARVWSQAIARCKANPEGFTVDSQWEETMAGLSEGSQTTLGAYSRPWQ